LLSSSSSFINSLLSPSFPANHSFAFSIPFLEQSQTKYFGAFYSSLKKLYFLYFSQANNSFFKKETKRILK